MPSNNAKYTNKILQQPSAGKVLDWNPIGSTKKSLVSFFLYILQCESTGRFYVGQTQNLQARFEEPRTMEANLFRGVHHTE